MASKRIATIYIRADGKQAKEEVKEISNGLSELDARQAKAAIETLNRLDLSVASRKIQAVGQSMKQVGEQISSMGRSLTLSITAPLTALGALGVKSALQVDAVRTKLTALVGDAESANRKIDELRKLADESVGVTRQGAMETFAQLKGIGGVADQTINRLIVSMGRLNAAFKIDDMDGFVRNLNQIFSQGFERTDIKEAIGRVPFFEQLIEQAFGTKDAEKLKELQAAGKLTLDSWLAGISNAIDNDSRIGNIQDNLSSRFAKGWERMSDALAPLGEEILRVVAPAFEILEGVVMQATEWFRELSPAAKAFVVALGGIAAAAGPVLVVIGGIVTAIGGLVMAIGAIVGSASTIAIVLAAVVGGLLQLGPPIAAAIAWGYALYTAWETNFGGIRDFVEDVAEAVKIGWAAAMAAFGQVTQDVLAKVADWWREHADEIKASLAVIEGYVKAGLDRLRQFWAENGDDIVAVVKTAWALITTAIGGAVDVILGTVRAFAALIRGDWAALWDSLKTILLGAVTAWAAVLAAGLKGLVDIVKAGLTGIWSLHSWAFSQALELGKAIIQGLIKGMLALHPAAVGVRIIGDVISSMRSAAKVQSPSKVTTEIGQNIADGLSVGMENRSKAVRGRAKQLADETIKEFQKALQEFQKLSGLSPEQVTRMQETDRQRQGASDIREIIKLRAELGTNNDLALPFSPESAAAELRYLQEKKKQIEDAVPPHKALEEVQKRLDEMAKRRRENFESLREQLPLDGAEQIANLEKEIDLLGVVDALERQQIENRYELEALRRAYQAAGFNDEEIAELITIRQLQQDIHIGLLEEFEAKRKILEADRERAKEAEKAAKQAEREYRHVFDSISGSIQNVLHSFRGGLRSGLKGLLGEVQSFFDNLVGSIFKRIGDSLTKMLMDKLFGGSGGGASSGGLGSIFGGGGGAASSGGGIFGNIFGGLFGGGSGADSAGWSFGGGGSALSSGNPLDGLNIGTGGFNPRTGTYSNPLGRQGGFGIGTGLSLAGIGANLIGGAIGGRVGGFISNIGTGVAMGAQIGSIIPGIGTVIGAAVGGIVGFFASLFGGDKKKKRDKNEKLPELTKGFSESMTQLRELLNQVRQLKIDPDEAIRQAQDIRKQIASGFGIQFESKKYRKQAQQMISQNLGTADGIISQIRTAAEQARGAADRRDRILPEWNTGVYLGPEFRRRNGMLPGSFTGVDSLPSLLAPGEMVLNPMQMRSVRRAAGFDVFKFAGIPGYASGGMVSASAPSVAAMPTQISVQPQIIVHVEGVAMDDKISAWVESDGGRRVQAKVYKKMRRAGELT